jgi:hypothetical protein
VLQYLRVSSTILFLISSYPSSPSTSTCLTPFNSLLNLLGVVRDVLTVTSPIFGEYVCDLIATCVAPLPQGPFNFTRGEQLYPLGHSLCTYSPSYPPISPHLHQSPPPHPLSPSPSPPLLQVVQLKRFLSGTVSPHSAYGPTAQTLPASDSHYLRQPWDQRSKVCALSHSTPRGRS